MCRGEGTFILEYVFVGKSYLVMAFNNNNNIIIIIIIIISVVAEVIGMRIVIAVVVKILAVAAVIFNIYRI